MPETPIQVTEQDVKEPNLLLRYLRKVSDRIAGIGDRLGKLESAAPPPSISAIRDQLQATGTAPIRLDNLRGVAAEPQPARVQAYSTEPSGLVLQALYDSQLVTVGSSSTGDTLYRVVGGNPNTLRQINPAVSIGAIVTVKDADFTLTGDVDTTKHGKFEIDTHVGAGSTVTLTYPASDRVIAGTNVDNAFTASQTLTLNQNAATSIGITNTNSTGTGATARYNATNDVAIAALIAHGSGRTGVRYGVTIGNHAEVLAASGYLGLLIGCQSTGYIVFGTNDTEALRIDTNQNLLLKKKITTYNNIGLSTNGGGVPSIVATAHTIATTSSVALTTVYTTPATPAFAYRISFNMFGVTTGVSTGEVQSTISASNGTSIINITSSLMDLQASATSYYLTAPLRVGGTSPIQVSISRTGTSTGQYSMYMAVEAL